MIQGRLIMSKRRTIYLGICLCVLFTLVGCGPKTEGPGEFSIQFEKYTLGNGLEVVLHEDRSDPIVAVAIQYHVGSNREVVGRTGFAHLFEHMMFQESQHVPQDTFFKKIQGAGGSLNGGTGNDGTIYFEVVPKNALEMVLWLESDRLGFLRPTITPEAFANQQGIVMNEKRQGVDNRPYGHTGFILGKLLYPEGHPYNWQVIGSMQDLAGATLADVHEFHEKWYRPNNATLVVAGDFDRQQTVEWIEKYFGEINSGGNIEDPQPEPARLVETKTVYLEDNFAKSPELNMIFPTIQEYHDDAYPLAFLGQLLAYGKKAPLYQVLVEEQKLAPSVSGYQLSQEIAGEFHIRIRAFPQVSLNDVKDAIFKTFDRFEAESFTEQDVSRIKAGIETQFYNGVSSILGKSFQLARYNEYAGSPGYISEDIAKLKAVTKDDILRVYNKYIKGKPYVMSSFVPKGKADLIVKGSELFVLPDAEIPAPAPSDEEFVVEKIATSFDRSIEPAPGPEPAVSLPKIWKDGLNNGIRIFGIEHRELPLIQFSLSLKGGQWLEDLDKSGVANLVSRMLMQGTRNKTPIELEEAIDDLGANIFIRGGRESISVMANCLSSQFSDVYKLVEEILLEPRWDETEFERLKKETIESINRNKANPSAVSFRIFNRLAYGAEHIFSRPTAGTLQSLPAITLEDLKNYYAEFFSPSVCTITIVGDVDQQTVRDTFKPLYEKWEALDVVFPEYPLPKSPEKAALYFVDIPGARQSVIRIGNLALSFTDPDYFPATVMNYRLGGSFNGIVNLILREEKGFTYGARTSFSGSLHPGTFAATSSVQSNATLESVQIFRDEMTKYRDGITDAELLFTKDALIRSNTRRFETLNALLGMLQSIAVYGLPDDYIKQQEQIIKDMDLAQHQDLAQQYIDPAKMIYLIVGDAATQMAPLSMLGLGKPVPVKQQ